MTLATLVTRDRLLTIGMLILCAVAAFALVRSDVVECLIEKWARFRQAKRKPHTELACAHPKPIHAAHLVDEQEPHPMLLHESFGSDLSDAGSNMSDAADSAKLHPVVVDEDPAEASPEYKSPFGEAPCSASAPKVQQKRVRKARKP